MKKILSFTLVFCLFASMFGAFAMDIDTLNLHLSSKYMILVNRENKVSSDYVPSDLVTYPGSNYKLEKTCSGALQELISACSAAGGERLVLYSGYRTYQTQYNKYYNKINYYINNGYSREQATQMTDQYYAPPGGSEHHTGLAADICTPSIVNKHGQLHESFGNTKEGLWLKNNAHKYGFILRYEKGKESITGYNYEPWHFRYVGKSAAMEIYSAGLTMEEYVAALKTAQNKLSSPPKITVTEGNVSLSAAAGTTIRYTDDGTTPTPSSKTYSTALNQKNKTYKAISCYNGYTSKVTAFTITEYGDVFKDVNVKHWYYSYVNEAVHQNIFSGMGNLTFAPNQNMSRAMMVKVLANISGVDLSSYKTDSVYSDVPTKKWYNPAINWATEQNLVKGVGKGKFAPDADITREQVCTIFYNYAPQDFTLSENTFTDQAKISSWATASVAFCYHKGIVNGYPDHSFQPQKSATRAEVAKITLTFISQ